MTNREKVLNGLRCLSGDKEMVENPCVGCGYTDCQTYAICVAQVATDALELLMKQEPVKPTPHMYPIGMYDAMATEYLCGNCGCGLTLNDRWRTKYCPECGKAVKWDD